MWQAFLGASLLFGQFAWAAAQDSPDKPPADGAAQPADRNTARRPESSRRQDGADAEALQRLTELEKKLADKPDDKTSLPLYLKSLDSYVNAAVRSAQRLAGKQPSEAVKRFQLAQTAVKQIPDGIDDAQAKREFERLRRIVAQTEERLARVLKHEQLIGTKAAPLKVEHWASGGPLTDSDLKGKVVLLDFFAVWCRPCIETYPELASWREKYGEGLVIVGLTKYYNYQWDERIQGPREARSELPHETEHEMLQKFAELHKLKHSLGTQSDTAFFDFYGVTAIPQLVIVDREGVIRCIRAGVPTENIPEIAATLDKLLGDSVTGVTTDPR